MNVLRSLERFTRTDLAYLFKGGFWITVGQVVSSGSAFVLAIAFANLLPVATYGAYKYMLSIAGFFSVFTLPGMSVAITRSVAQGNDGNVGPALRARVACSFVGVVAALIGSGYYFWNGNFELGMSLTIIAVTLPFFDTFTLYNAYLSGKRDFKTQTFYHLVTQGISVVSLVIALSLSNSLSVILASYFVPLGLARLVAYFRATRLVPKNTSGDSETLTYGTHLSMMNVLSIASQTVDKFLLWHFLGPIELAVYSFALAMPEQLKGPMKGVGDLALPKFSERTHDEIKQAMPLLWYRSALYGGALLLIALAYCALAPYIFAALFPQYMDSVLYSQIFAFTIVTGVTVVPLAALAAHKKTAEQYAINIAHPVLQIALFWALIPGYGILGAVMSILITRVLVTAMVIAATMRAFRN